MMNMVMQVLIVRDAMVMQVMVMIAMDAMLMGVSVPAGGVNSCVPHGKQLSLRRAISSGNSIKWVDFTEKLAEFTKVMVDHYIKTCRVPLQRGAKPGYLENARDGEDGDAIRMDCFWHPTPAFKQPLADFKYGPKKR